MLSVLAAVAEREEEARLALERWELFVRSEREHQGHAERRFRKRSYERARDRALMTLGGKNWPAAA